MFENVRGIARPTFAHYLRWIVAHLHHPELVRKTNEDHAAHTERLEALTRAPAYEVLVVQVNGKIRARLEAEPGLEEAGAVALALAHPSVQAHVDGKTVRKQIYVKDKLLNIVV